MIHVTVRTPIVLLLLVWPPPLSLATTRGISVDFFSSGYLDVSVPRVPYVTLWIHVTLHDSSPCGFPHSEICGSKLICSSPQLIAACHVLLRLLMPRHSPYALVRLNFLYIVPILWFSLNCLSFFEHFRSGFYWLLFAVKKQFSRLLHFVLSCAFAPRLRAFHLSVKLYAHACVCHSLSFGKTNNLFRFICPLLFVFYSKNFSSIRLSKILRTLSSAGRSGWTRTIDLALIRRAL